MGSAKLKQSPRKQNSPKEVSSIEKREQILQGAMQVFLAHGYAGTSMDRVAATAGVSKQTIYSHFQDKQGLFTVLIERVTIHRLQNDLGSEPLCGEPAILLRRVAHAFLDRMSSPDYLNLLRVIVAESGRFPELAELYNRTVIQRGRHILTTYFQAHSELNILDPEAMAHVFAGTLVSFCLAQEILHGKLTSSLTGEKVVDELIDLTLKRSTVQKSAQA